MAFSRSVWGETTTGIERAKDITARRTLLVRVSFQSWETEAQRGDETC